MKKFFTVIMVLIIGTALTLGMAYAIDKNRMETGKPVVFSTWGKDYTPADKNTKTEPVQSTNSQEPVTPDDVNADVNSDVQKVTDTAKEVTLYFADADLLYLCSEKRTIEIKDSLEKAVVEAVIAGPQYKDYLSSVTPDVKVHSAQVADGSNTCVVDLSKEFVLNNTGGSSIETFALYSIVNSLCELPGIDNVKININGDENAVFGGHYDISKPIEKDMSIVAG